MVLYVSNAENAALIFTMPISTQWISQMWKYGRTMPETIYWHGLIPLNSVMEDISMTFG